MPDPALKAALRDGGVIDMTTRGKKTGRYRRIEITFVPMGDRIFISGKPGRRSWLANLVADPHFVFHLKGDVQADLPATAHVITETQERQRICGFITTQWGRQSQYEAFLADAPLVEVTFDDSTILAAGANAA